MKKSISILLAVIMMCSAVIAPVSAFAATGVWVGSDYYQYEVLSGSTAKIISHNQHNSSESVLYIPSSVDGYTVTEIGNAAFSKSFDSIKEYVIPSTVTAIGDSAFSQGGGNKMERLTIPSSVQNVGYHAFASAKKLTSLTIEEGVKTLGDYAFDGADSLKKVVIPSSVQSIGKYCFSSCDALSSVTIKNGVKTIGYSAFSGGAYSTVTIPKSVTNIDDWAFDTATLTKVTVMNSKCSICESSMVFYGSNLRKQNKKVKLCGFNNSTIQQYAKKYNYSYQFVSLTNPTATKITKLTAKSKAFSVKWSKAANCCGYQIQYSLKKNMSKPKTIKIKSSTTLSKTVKKLKKGKVYFVRVRAYNVYGGKTYNTKWSAVKKIKTK